MTKFQATKLTITPRQQMTHNVTFGRREAAAYPEKMLQHMCNLLSLMDIDISESYVVSGV